MLAKKENTITDLLTDDQREELIQMTREPFEFESGGDTLTT